MLKYLRTTKVEEGIRKQYLTSFPSPRI